MENMKQEQVRMQVGTGQKNDTKEALVVVDIGEIHLELTPVEARKIAEVIGQAAQASEWLSKLTSFCEDRLGMDLEQARAFTGQFAAWSRPMDGGWEEEEGGVGH